VSKYIYPNGIRKINKCMKDYYVYTYSDPDTLVPFYVGIGRSDRKNDHLKEAIKQPNPIAGEHKLNTIRKLLREGRAPLIELVETNLTREHALHKEEILIAQLGRKDLGTGPLTNQTIGGDGYRGWSPEQRQKVSDRNKRLGIVPPNQKGRKQNRLPEYKAIPAIICDTGEKTKVLLSDPRWETGEIVGVNKGIVQNQEWKRKISEGVSKLKWWHNASGCIRSKTCPGPDYIRGRGKVK
jgi:hypothetical protein